MNEQDLPIAARSKLAQCRAPMVALRVDAQARSEAVTDLRSQAYAAEKRLKSMNPSRDAAAMQKCEEELSFFGAEIDKLIDLQAGVQRKMNAAGQLVVRIESWIGEQTGGFAVATASKVSPHKGETPKDACMRTRQDISQLSRERHALSLAPLPVEELKAVAREYVRASACEPRIVVNPRVAEERFMGHPSRQTFWRDIGPPDFFPVMAWLYPEKVLAMLDARIDEAVKLAPHEPISEEAREKRLKELDVAILELERAEESLIEQCIADGVVVERRYDANPLAVLGIAPANAKKASAALAA